MSFEWLWSYLTFQRGARLIIGREPRGGNATPVPGQATAAEENGARPEGAPRPAPVLRPV